MNEFEIRKTNIFDSDCQAIINTVNEVGVMGKGIALATKRVHPDVFIEYKKRCDNGLVRVGKMDLHKVKGFSYDFVINFPTKKHWRHDSKLQWIKDGIMDLNDVIKDNEITSIALPCLGCSNGNLNPASSITLLRTFLKCNTVHLYR